MDFRRQCCCEGKVGRYVQVTPVIPIPEEVFVAGEFSFYIDIEVDEELTLQTPLYDGGPASTGEIPIVLGLTDALVMVPSESIFQSIMFPDGTIPGKTNISNIESLRHHGWTMGSFENLQAFTLQELQEKPGYKILFKLPNTETDDEDPDLIMQLDEGGFFFLGGQFNANPALVQASVVDNFVDADGNDLPPGTPPTQRTIHRAYNPKIECVIPEQLIYFGDDPFPSLLLDFTAPFPDSITIDYYTQVATGTLGLPPIEEREKSVTYQKFALGGNTAPVTGTDSVSGATVVTGFDDQPVIGSATLKFGYRSTDTLIRYQRDNSPNPDLDLVVQVPSIPFYYISNLSTSSSYGEYKTGELSATVRTGTPYKAGLHRSNTYGNVVENIAGCLPGTDSPGFGCGSYKGDEALEKKFVTMNRMLGFDSACPGVGSGGVPSFGLTDGNATNFQVFGTKNYPHIGYDSSRSFSLVNMGNPAYGFHKPLDKKYGFDPAQTAITQGLTILDVS
jgi:hypothetical protein